MAYLISDAGLEAVGAPPHESTASEESAPAKEVTVPTIGKPKKTTPKPKQEGETGEPKMSKQQLIITMLKRPEGATLAQMMEATGWQRHSLHGAMAGGLKKKLGLAITSSKEGDERIYKIAA